MPNNRILGRASMEAQRVLARHETPWEKPIDVFRIVQDEGIWLASKPLGAGLFGFYLRDGGAAGIVLNSNHPETLQRYTCAHELGHHVLDHASHLDGEQDVEGPLAKERANELAAQVFAGNLLMPLQAVNRAMRNHGISRGSQPSSGQVYLLARDLDVSFSAAVWQMVTLGRLGQSAAARYVRAGAAAAKRALRPGDHPEGDNRADLVLLDQRLNGQATFCRVGDELRLRLPEKPSTGYRWELIEPATGHVAPVGGRWKGDDLLPGEPEIKANPATDAPVRLVSEHLLLGPDGSRLGARGVREHVLLAQSQGICSIRAELGRPWLPEVAEAEFVIRVRVAATHTLDGFARDQLVAHQARVAGSVA